MSVYEPELDSTKFDTILHKFPQLEVCLFGNILSKKLTRDLLDIDRWMMDILYRDLIECGAVTGHSSTTFKATQATLKYLKVRKK